MSIWLEIHCDTQTAGPDAVGKPLCYGMNGNQVGEMSKNMGAALKTLQFLKRRAKHEGWLLSGSNWTCPACREAEGMK